MKLLKASQNKLIKNCLLFSILTICISCASSEVYFFENKSNQNKTITLFYAPIEDETLKAFNPPDSLRISKEEMAYAPHKWYNNVSTKTPYQQKDKLTYQVEIQSGYTLFIPAAYFYSNSLEKAVIATDQEILFSDEYDKPYEVKADRSIEVTYKSKLIGNNYYLIRIK